MPYRFPITSPITASCSEVSPAALPDRRHCCKLREGDSACVLRSKTRCRQLHGFMCTGIEGSPLGVSLCTRQLGGAARAGWGLGGWTGGWEGGDCKGQRDRDAAGVSGGWSLGTWAELAEQAGGWDGGQPRGVACAAFIPCKCLTGKPHANSHGNTTFATTS